MKPYAMLYRLFIFNAMVLAWLVYTDLDTHWMRSMVAADSTRLSILIITLFVVTCSSLFGHAWRTDRYLKKNEADLTEGARLPVPTNGGKWRLDEIEHIGEAASWMFMIGLIGTILGLSISLAKVDLNSFDNVQGLKSVAVQMIAGLRIELGVTVVGAVFGLWTAISYTILKYTVSHLAHREG